jgi:hypothetical protein
MPVQPEMLIRIQAACAAAYIECVAMHTANVERTLEGKALAYPEEAFRKLIEEHGIGYNSVLELIQMATY